MHVSQRAPHTRLSCAFSTWYILHSKPTLTTFTTNTATHTYNYFSIGGVEGKRDS